MVLGQGGHFDVLAGGDAVDTPATTTAMAASHQLVVAIVSASPQATSREPLSSSPITSGVVVVVLHELGAGLRDQLPDDVDAVLSWISHRFCPSRSGATAWKKLVLRFGALDQDHAGVDGALPPLALEPELAVEELVGPPVRSRRRATPRRGPEPARRTRAGWGGPRRRRPSLGRWRVGRCPRRGPPSGRTRSGGRTRFRGVVMAVWSGPAAEAVRFGTGPRT